MQPHGLWRRPAFVHPVEWGRIIWKWRETNRIGLLELSAVIVFIMGVVLRFRYSTFYHPPMHYVYTDARDYMRQALSFLSADASNGISGIIWPPGTAAVMAGLFSLDASLHLATVVVTLLGSMVPLLVAHAGGLLTNRKTGMWALMMASASMGYIHYTGMFMSESFFIFTVSLAIWSLALALSVIESAPLLKGTGLKGWLGVMAPGIPVGSAWALSMMFRPNAGPVLLGILLGVSAYWIALRQWRKTAFVVSVLMTVGVTIVPLVHRCTLANNNDICVISTNTAMNSVMGQAGEYRSVRFTDPRTGKKAKWTPPSLGVLRYKGIRDIPLAQNDHIGLLKWILHRYVNEPHLALLRAMGNGLDLFQLDYWPQRQKILGSRPIIVASQLFMLLVLVPAVIVFVRGVPRILRREAALQFVVVWFGIGSVVVLAALSMGEARYRLPFDAFWIVLAAGFWQGGRGETLWRRSKVAGDTPRPMNPIAGKVAFLAIAAAVTIGAAIYVIGVSHPDLNWGHHFNQMPVARAIKSLHRSSERMDRIKKNNHPWDDDTITIECGYSCSELQVQWEKPQQASKLDVSLSGSDLYQIRLYYRGKPVHTRHIRPLHAKGSRKENGLCRTTVRLSNSDLKFDRVGILPLFGDGSYSVGHVVPI
ncbi:MAG: hypothetical protein JXX14_03240 [Deltaproteobacteria bacterium]|nr:hypothetical protein [Deltaproteobacteria bacterium]